jgi:beta-glucanase (GH16 family)
MGEKVVAQHGCGQVTAVPPRPRRCRALIALTTSLAIAVTMLIAGCAAAPVASTALAWTPPIVASAASSPAASVTNPGASSFPQATSWRLAFSTDFPGTALNTSTWDECYPWSPVSWGCNNFGNANEVEWFQTSQVHVGNGMLALTAKHTPTAGTDANGNPKEYACRSGMVTTYPSFSFTDGKVQVVAHLPFGTGLWPAIWLVPEDGTWPPEIDIIEHWGTQSTARATLHTNSGTQIRGTIPFPQADQGWHTYTLYWTSSRISVYFDNKLALNITKNIPTKAMYLLLDLADDSNAAGSCTGTMLVKSVKIWQAS